MTAQLHVIHNNPNLRPRACGSCRYAPKKVDANARCTATANFIDLERIYEINACGISGKLWEPQPPRIGLVGHVKRLIWGDA